MHGNTWLVVMLTPWMVAAPLTLALAVLERRLQHRDFDHDGASLLDDSAASELGCD